MHLNLNVLTQQILGLAYPQDYKVLGLEPLSLQPYSFSMVLNNGRISRALTIEVEIVGEIPKFWVKAVNKVAVERFELMSDFDKPFVSYVRPIAKTVEEGIPQVHSVHVMNQQKELLKNRLLTMMSSLYKLHEIKVTHNDGITADGYFTYTEGQRNAVRAFRMDSTGKLEILDFSSKVVVDTHVGVAFKSGYSQETRAAVAQKQEDDKEKAIEEAKAAMSPEEKRRQYSKTYYERNKTEKKKGK